MERSIQGDASIHLLALTFVFLQEHIAVAILFKTEVSATTSRDATFPCLTRYGNRYIFSIIDSSLKFEGLDGAAKKLIE